MSSRKRRWLLWVGIGLLVFIGAFAVWATHGYTWSIYTPIYDKLLHSVPIPPGLLPEQDYVDVNPEWPWGMRSFELDSDHLATVDFMLNELPRNDWSLETPSSRTVELQSGGYLKVDELLFARRYWMRRWWLYVHIASDTDVGGTEHGNSRLLFEIYRDNGMAYSRHRLPTPTPVRRILER